MQLIATTAFGLEAVVSRELEQLGFPDRTVSDGRVEFSGDASAIARSNLWLRSAGRVLVKLGEFAALDFGELFDRVAELPWTEWLTEDAKFPIRARSVRSQLTSEPDCQSIVKKAVVESLKRTWPRDWFEETGPEFPIDVSLRNNRVVVSLDTTGHGLHRRGYRTWTGSAPLRETLAAALVQLSFWEPGRVLADPCCGTGTLLIEAALIGQNRAPGLGREFLADSWPCLQASVWDQARQEARDLVRPLPDILLTGTDIDSVALELGRRNAAQAGLEQVIEFREAPVAEFSSHAKYGCLITNPPYGQRMGEQETVSELHAQLARVVAPLETWSVYVLTADRGFQRSFGRTATRRRKLFNGRIECTYYQYAGPRPPWSQ